MNHHTIRVYLHFAEPKHYQHLEESLKRFGIESVIRQKDGKAFRLPQGEYYTCSARSADEIRELVYEVASQLARAAVVVTTGASVAWVGLEATAG